MKASGERPVTTASWERLPGKPFYTNGPWLIWRIGSKWRISRAGRRGVLNALDTLATAQAWVAREERRGWVYAPPCHISGDGFWTIRRHGRRWRVSYPCKGGRLLPSFSDLETTKEWIETIGEQVQREAEIEEHHRQYERDTGFRRPK